MAAENGTPGGTSGTAPLRFRCSTCSSKHKEAVAAAFLAHTPLRELSSRFGLSRSSLSRHRRHVGSAIVRATARIEQPPVEPVEIAAYENHIFAKSQRVETEKYEIYKEQRALGDLRGASQTLQGIVDIHRWQYELMPASETEPPVEVRFIFPDSGASRQDAAFETARASPGGAATGGTADAATSAIPEIVEAATPLLAREEPVSVAAEPSPPPAPAAPPPPPMLPPLDLTFRTFDDPDVPRPPSADALARTDRWRR